MGSLKLTEAEMLTRLRTRYTQKTANGEAWVFVTHVRSAAGFDARRTIDAIAMSLWPSRGLELTGFEVKCSRTDWVKEMRDPSKAEEFAQLVDRWYLVVADPSIVHLGELPPTWGLMVAHGKGLRCLVEAPRLRELGVTVDDVDDRSVLKRKRNQLPDAFNRSFLASLLRAAAKGSLAVEELEAAKAQAREEERKLRELDLAMARSDLEKLRGRVREFEQASGLKISSSQWGGHKPEEIGRTVNLLLRGDADAERLEQRLQGVITSAERIAEDARRILDRGATLL